MKLLFVYIFLKVALRFVEIAVKAARANSFQTASQQSDQVHSTWFSIKFMCNLKEIS